LTGNVLIDLAISLTGIAILVGLSRLIFGKSAEPLSQRRAANRLAFDEPDFAPVAWVVDVTAGAAIARNGAGEIALIKAAGDGLATRRAGAGAFSCAREGAVLTIAPPDLTYGGVTVTAANEAEAMQWALHIAGGEAIMR